MLTRQGWIVAVGSVALIVFGRLLGIFELFLTGAAGAALVIVCAVAVGLTRLRLDVVRELHPPRVHAGTPSRVELQVRNRGSRRTPLLSLRDPVGEGRSARVVLAPVQAGAMVRAAYRLPTDRRGILHVGPLQVEVGDPFGLTSISAPGAPVAELTVWPAIEAVRPLPHTNGNDPHGAADVPNAISHTGEDFHALRPYAVGDDLRRVHWPSTARADDLMVRQDEMPWESRATVVVDTRRGAHTDASIERAVSAAASVTVACARQHYLLRLMTTAGDDTGFGAGAAHVDAIMELLATVPLTSNGDLASVVARLRRSGSGGAVAVILGTTADRDAEIAVPLRRSFGHVTIAGFGTGGDGRRTASRTDVLVVDDDTPFAPLWNLAMAGTARRRTGAGTGRR